MQKFTIKNCVAQSIDFFDGKDLEDAGISLEPGLQRLF
jgi:hypothetical protein